MAETPGKVKAAASGKGYPVAFVSLTAWLVPDYDAGVAFATGGLGLAVLEDTPLEGEKRWVVVGGPKGGRLLVAKATTARQRDAVGDQAGGRVFLFLQTDDFDERAAAIVMAGGVFEEAPRTAPYGAVGVFRDPFGNRWDLIAPAQK